MILSYVDKSCATFLIGGMNDRKHELKNQWLIRILESYEKVGISKPIIERFILFYGKEDSAKNVKLARSPKGFRNSH
jgi:hypothetical protein